MNLDDLILLRGWINHLNWPQLDSQVPADRAPARQRVKGLRRQLAVKARFHGQPALAECWLGPRGVTETWSRQALFALHHLNRLDEPIPALEQAVQRWFPDAVCAALPDPIKTLADLIEERDLLKKATAYFAKEQ
jgi:hypothetical protein